MLRKAVLFSVLAAIAASPFFASSANIVDLRVSIDEKNSQITELEKEIASLQQDIEKTGEVSNSLKNQIKVVNSTILKLSADINLTRKKIEAAELTLEKLSFEIDARQNDISRARKSLADLVRNIYEMESQSLVEILLANASLSNFFSDMDYIESLGAEMEIRLSELKEVKAVLEKEQAEREDQRKKLLGLKSELDDRKSIEEGIRREKNSLLKLTQNKEAEYKDLLAERLSKKEALEAEIFEIEEQIRVIIDPDSLPRTGSGVLLWPLDKVTLTQYFGNTPFATRNPQIYNGKGHNGIDLRAAIGTPVKSAMEGRVAAVGNTDDQCRGVSYGRWVLIEHPNNLSTLYAHLSLIRVSPGSEVGRGEIVGYSGNTGYTTGPHLHFAVFATQGVEVQTIKSRICGTNMRLPVGSFNSYLNPLSYL